MTREQRNNCRFNGTLAIYLSALLGGLNAKDAAIICAFFACVYAAFVRPVFVEPFLSFRMEMVRPRVPVAIVVFFDDIVPISRAPLAYPA